MNGCLRSVHGYESGCQSHYLKLLKQLCDEGVIHFLVMDNRGNCNADSTN